MKAQFRADITGAMILFHAMKGPEMMAAVQMGVGRAAHRTEETMRKSLWGWVYAQPESDSYERTGRLLNGAHAAPPGTDHSGDDEIALTMDMHNEDPMGVVRVTGLLFASEVGDWVSYAYYVHEGMGRGNRVPSPFSTQALLDSGSFLAQEVNSAVAAVIVAMAR